MLRAIAGTGGMADREQPGRSGQGLWRAVAVACAARGHGSGGVAMVAPLRLSAGSGCSRGWP